METASNWQASGRGGELSPALQQAIAIFGEHSRPPAPHRVNMPREMGKPAERKQKPAAASGGLVFHPAERDNGQEGETWPDPLGTAPGEWRLIRVFRALDEISRNRLLMFAADLAKSEGVPFFLR